MKKDNRLKTKAFPPEPTPEEWACYTDLALEQRNLLLREAPGAPEVEGIQTRVRLRRDLRTTWIRVSTPEGSAALRKPMGTYVTLEVNPEALRMKKAQDRIVRTLAGELADLMALSPADPVLVVGLGNRKVIYDALGPLTLDQLQVTGHLRGRLPAEYGPIRSVFAFEPGVLGRTGMETGSLLRAVADALRPAAILAVDALAARNRSTLCATIQLTDTGLVPGSGVTAGRSGLTRESIGIPVFALGVPTISTLEQAADFVVTPRSVTREAALFSGILGRSINLCLHPSLTEEQLSQAVEAT